MNSINLKPHILFQKRKNLLMKFPYFKYYPFKLLLTLKVCVLVLFHYLPRLLQLQQCLRNISVRIIVRLPFLRFHYFIKICLMKLRLF